ncbi:hypothetical protein K435DRAFT_967708 [Dendrothele bispora CBS 962.96]|uniref:Uncharacterized protein n=1 Tax=Dendrothele bispora (strain CBS 962.96) TaxID=1314807 RepID=A0A4S8LTQ3_DENBC|nr:hypothetical protein K435DRAFT_967708 [Dendrothele bispora CBS 962.96]
MSDSQDGNSYAPQEPLEIITLERYDFAALQLSCIFYGFSVVVFVRCMSALLWPRSGRQQNTKLAVYTFFLFALGTIYIAMNGHYYQLAFIDNRNFPGGPEAYELFIYSTSVPRTANSVFIIANWLADALLLFRCKIIWQGNAWILILPVILFLADISMGILFLYQVSVPDANLFTQSAVNFGLAYFSLSTTLNTLMTLLICSRLIIHQRRLIKYQTLPSKNGLSYMSIVSMLVESSALYAVFSLLFIGTYASGNAASGIFLAILSQAQIIAPLLIIARVATRKAWTAEDSLSVNGGQNSSSWRANSGPSTQVDSFPMESSPKLGSFNDRMGSGTISSTVEVKIA